jgi:hypothetical protein
MKSLEDLKSKNKVADNIWFFLDLAASTIAE